MAHELATTYYGFDIFGAKNLNELNIIYAQVESSKYDDEIKKKIFKKINKHMKYFRLQKSTVRKILI